MADTYIISIREHDDLVARADQAEQERARWEHEAAARGFAAVTAEAKLRAISDLCDQAETIPADVIRAVLKQP